MPVPARYGACAQLVLDAVGRGAVEGRKEAVRMTVLVQEAHLPRVSTNVGCRRVGRQGRTAGCRFGSLSRRLTSFRCCCATARWNVIVSLVMMRRWSVSSHSFEAACTYVTQGRRRRRLRVGGGGCVANGGGSTRRHTPKSKRRHRQGYGQGRRRPSKAVEWRDQVRDRTWTDEDDPS